MSRRCDTCEFWVLGGAYGVDSQTKCDVDDREGHCRRHAPKPWNDEGIYQGLKHLTHLSWNACTDEEKDTDFSAWEETHAGTVVWPVTTAQDWCGDWASATPLNAGVSRHGTAFDPDVALSPCTLALETGGAAPTEAHAGGESPAANAGVTMSDVRHP